MGATISSEQTAAAEGTVGELRRDPFAMLPFCGYNMADYWGHWLKVGRVARPRTRPTIFQVNWFRKGDDGSFLWPGFGENSRVLEWIVAAPRGSTPTRCEHADRPAARRPTRSTSTASTSTDAALEQLFDVDRDSWLAECDLTEEYFAQFGDRVPAALKAELASLRYHLQHQDA